MEPQDTSPSALQAHLKRLWIHGFLAGCGVLFVILLICLLVWGWPVGTPEAPEEAKPTLSEAPATPAPPPAPKATPLPSVATPAPLETQLSDVLAKLGQANQQKDLHQLLRLYSPSFPDLPLKAQEISRSWATYDYLSLNFKLTEINALTPDSASARATWKIKTRNRRTQEIKDITRVYLVGFANESGRWRIQSLERVEKVAGRDKPS